MRRRRKPNNVGLALVVAAFIIAGGYLAVTRDVPLLNPPFEIKAAFRESNGLKKNSPVRIAGVEVGKVTKVEHMGGGSDAAIVTMSIKDKGRPIHNDATAKIRPRIFLEGNFFVEISPGRPDSPELGEDGMIPADRTANPVQLDQVLKVLKTDTRANLRGTFAELFQTYEAGGGDAARRTLDYQPAAYKYSAIVAEALLGEQPGDLNKFISSQGLVSQALDKDPAALMGLISNFNTTAAALASQQAALQAGVAELPRTLNTALPTLSALNAAFPSLRRFARDAQPGIRSTGPTVDVVLPLVRQLRGLVGQSELRGLSRDLRRSTPPLTRLSRQTVPVLESLRQFASCASTTLVPYGNSTLTDPSYPATGKVFQDIPKSFVGLAGESRSFDANGQFFKVLGSGGLTTVDLGAGMVGTAAAPMQGTRPAPQSKRPPLEPEQPCENQQNPDLRADAGAAPAQTRVSPDNPVVKARLAKAQETAVEVLRGQLAANGDKTKVSDKAATPEQVSRAIARLKRGEK